jgi:hypothetical protein
MKSLKNFWLIVLFLLDLRKYNPLQGHDINILFKEFYSFSSYIHIYGSF